MRARPYAQPTWEAVGTSVSGKMPQRLLTRMKEKSAIRNGRYLRKSCPIMSRAMPLRMKKYAVSPMNWLLLGTRLFLRAMISQKAMTKITETAAIRMYLSNHSGPFSNSGGRSKLETPGAWKPSVSPSPVSSGISPNKPVTSPLPCRPLVRSARSGRSARPRPPPRHRSAG